jgi:hypothetical protein
MIGANSYFRRRTLGSVMACTRFRRCVLAPRNARTVVTEDDMGEADTLRSMGTKIEGIHVAH